MHDVHKSVRDIAPRNTLSAQLRTTYKVLMGEVPLDL